MEKIKILLDTDIGQDIDDALTLSYLLCNLRCELMGITTVSGVVDERAQMASAICRSVGRDDIPIYPGFNECIFVEPRLVSVPQIGMVSNWSHRTEFPKNQALQFMQRTIRENPGEIVLLGIGPMGNIGRLFLFDPELPRLLKGIYLMCGRFRAFDFQGWLQKHGCEEDGSPTTGGAREWNALYDFYATKAVYDGQSPIHRSVGLDITSQVMMKPDEFQKSLTKKVPGPVLDIADIWFRDKNIITFHDPLATTTIFNDSICNFRRGNVSVELTTERLCGYTYFDPDKNGNHEVAWEVNPQAFFDEYFSVFR